MFSGSNQVYYSNDHGGPIAYVGYGLMIRPSSDTYKNQLVMQVAGGPTGGQGIPATYTQDDLDGTAIDAFWPSRRPLLKSKR